MSTTRNIHLKRDTTQFHAADRGLLCTTQGEHTVNRFYIPKVRHVKVTTLGRNAQVIFGTSMMITMAKSLWSEWEDGIMSAALGPNWNGEQS